MRLVFDVMVGNEFMRKKREKQIFSLRSCASYCKQHMLKQIFLRFSVAVRGYGREKG
jgi:hypothetical protein